MPRRAAPGDRAKLEAALSPSLRTALQELRELLDLDDWQASPLAAPFTQAAAVLMAARVAEVEDLEERAALDAAAIRLELAPDTVRSRSKRWPKESRPTLGHYAPCATIPNAATLAVNTGSPTQEGAE